MKIERMEPIITVEQTLELVRLGCGSRTEEMERAVAMSLKAIMCPAYIVNDPSDEVTK